MTTTTNTEAIKLLNQIITSTTESIKYIEGELSIGMLVGSPFLLCIELASDHDGRRVWGEWNGQKGFKHEATIPDHLCGTIQQSPEIAKKNVAILTARGEKASMVHYRTFLEQRLARNKQLVALWTEQRDKLQSA